ncbi:hypothetical protein ACFX14_005595 [Malus domestica]
MDRVSLSEGCSGPQIRRHDHGQGTYDATDSIIAENAKIARCAILINGTELSKFNARSIRRVFQSQE